MKNPFPFTGVLLTGPLALVVSIFLGAGCSKPASPPDVLARVGTNEIRTADLLREAERRRSQRKSVPEAPVLLEEMIEQETLLQRARQVGVDRDPQVARELNNLLISRLLEKEVVAQVEKVAVTAAEIQAEYESNRVKYSQPAKARLALLFQEVSRSSSETRRTEGKSRLLEARARLLTRPPAPTGGAPVPGFGSMALEFSDDQASRYRGGDIGWLEAGRTNYHWPHPVLAAGFTLSNGVPSEVIETDGGFYLVMKTDSRPGAIKSLAEVESALHQSLLLKKRRALDQAFREQARRQIGVVIQTNVLAGLKLPASERTPPRREIEPPALPAANHAQP